MHRCIRFVFQASRFYCSEYTKKINLLTIKQQSLLCDFALKQKIYSYTKSHSKKNAIGSNVISLGKFLKMKMEGDRKMFHFLVNIQGETKYIMRRDVIVHTTKRFLMFYCIIPQLRVFYQNVLS
jgi:hypothetical protein